MAGAFFVQIGSARAIAAPIRLDAWRSGQHGLMGRFGLKGTLGTTLEKPRSARPRGRSGLRGGAFHALIPRIGTKA